ncbi:MAG: hypothetical protein ABSH20_18210, partial [Tepidisphaeraceae bacterium]
GTPTADEPLGAALHRLRQYHTNLLNTYLKLLKKYQSAQNEPIQPATDDHQPPPATDYGPLTTDSAPAAQIEPNSPSAPLSTNNHQPSTTSQNEPIATPSNLPAQPQPLRCNVCGMIHPQGRCPRNPFAGHR